MKRSLFSGPTIGAMLLVAGSCIGAGMLALPILTGLAGFFPSMLFFLLSWVFMTFTALLVVEVNGWFQNQTNIVSMATKALGIWGRVLSWTLYLFLFYALLVAYISGSGSIFSDFLGGVFNTSFSEWKAAIFFTIAFGAIIYFGTKPVDIWNRILMAGLILTYFGMIFFGLSKIKGDLLLHSDWKYALIPLPILIPAFGFHNMIPSLTAYLKGDLKKVRTAIWGGSTIALFVYLVWELLILGVVPLEGEAGIVKSFEHGREAAHALKETLGASWVTAYAQGFAFFAITTSFLAQGLSLMHFLADGMKVELGKRKLPLLILTLAPPTFFSLIYPQVFFQALSFAGGICAVVLFGIMPALMVWIGRYHKRLSVSYQVFGGKTALLLIFAFSLLVLFVEISKLFNFSFF
jgi:tyrosine-specific transport protein